jgi:hypothetical protein
MEDAMAQFTIFVDNENCLAIMGFPNHLTDEEIRVAGISLEKNHTLFVLRSGYRIVVQMSVGEIISKLQTEDRGVDVEGTQDAPRP